VEFERLEAREWLAAHLRAWERHRVTFGTTSRAIPERSGTQAEGRIAREPFDEYKQEHGQGCGQVFRAGCIWCGPEGLTAQVMQRHAEQVPEGFAFTVMLSDDSLIYRFPYGHPDRARRGELNSGYLDPVRLQERAGAALDALNGRLGAVVLRMPPVYRTEELRAPEFVGRLDRFLGGLPRAYRYAVDLGTPSFNVPEYRACLRDHGAAHLLYHVPYGLDAGRYPRHVPSLEDAPALVRQDAVVRPAPYLPGRSSEAPPLLDQLLMPGIIPGSFCLACVYPERDREHEEESLALGIQELIRTCESEGAALTVLVGGDLDGGVNHSRKDRRGGDRDSLDRDAGNDGSAISALAGLLHSLDGELARRSPLRRRAA
jgi:hypothetical protein